MSMTPEYQEALEAVSRAADEMTRCCNEYQLAQTATGPGTNSSTTEALRKACEEARNAHDEAYADAWELIEQQPRTSHG